MCFVSNTLKTSLQRSQRTMPGSPRDSQAYAWVAVMPTS